MRKDQIAATLLGVLAAGVLLSRDPPPADRDERLVALALTYVLVLFWRVLAQMPSFGIMERFAADHRSPALQLPLALAAWALFLLFAYSAAFR